MSTRFLRDGQLDPVNRAATAPNCRLHGRSNPRNHGDMPALTRRHLKRPHCWHVYYGDVQVGSIGMRSAVPNEVEQWSWTCGFDSQRFRITKGTAPTFALALAELEEAWQAYLPGPIDADIVEPQRHRAWTTWKYAVHDADAVADSDFLWAGTLLLRRRN
jgi:hypothetical protein